MTERSEPGRFRILSDETATSQHTFLFNQQPHTHSEMSPGQIQEFVRQSATGSL